MYYYRKSNKNDYEDDIRNLDSKIDIIYSLLENITKDRNDLLQLFNSKINDNIPNENIFHNDVYVDSDNSFKLIFTCKSEPSNIYKYIFHIFIKSDFNNINLKFIINNKDFTYNINVDKFKYLKIEEKFIFNEIQNFKIYLKTDKPLTIMGYSSYEVLVNYHPVTILNNQDHIKRLIYKTNKLDDEVKENNKLIREFILKDIKKDDLPLNNYILYMDELAERIENNFINIYKKFDILDKKLNDYHMKFDKINEKIDIIISDEYTKIHKTYFPMKNYDLAQDRFFIYNEVIDIPLKTNTFIIFEYVFNSEYINIPLIINLKIDDVLEKDFNIHLKKHNEVRHMFKLDYNITKINFYLYLYNNEIYNDEKMEYLKKILFNNKKIKFNIFSFI